MRRIFLAIVALCLLSSLAVTAVEMTAREPGGVFLEGTPLAFDVTGVKAQCAYTVTDWLGAEVLSGVLEADGEVVLEALPDGYYWLRSGECVTSLCVLPTMESRGVKDGRLPESLRKSPFGMDTAQSWLAKPGDIVCPWFGGDGYRLVTELVFRAGIPHVRERLRWREVKGGAEQPMALGKYLLNSRMLSAHGITVSAMFHDSPPYAGRRPLLPRDLRALYEFTKEATLAYGDTICNWEFWNEPDIGFAPEAVWDFASAQKAAFLGIRSANKEIPIGNGAIALSCRNPYPKSLYENEIGLYSNFYNFHTYDFPVDYPIRYVENHSFLKSFGMDGRAIWCTESGPRMEGNAVAVPGHPDWKDHTPEQELVVAEFYPKSQLGHWMQGVSRNYYFVFPPCNEGEGAKSWGVLRRDGTVKPVYAAIATATARMGGAKLLGTLDVAEGVTAYLLEFPDGMQVLCHWANSELDSMAHVNPVLPDNSYERSLAIPLPDGEYNTCTIVGTPGTVVAQDGVATLSTNRYPSYLWGFRGLVPTKLAFSRGSLQDVEWDGDPTIVLQVDFPEGTVSMENQKCSMVMSGSSQRILVNIWNLDEKNAKCGRLCFEGAKLEFDGDISSESITIPPMGMASVPVTISAENPHSSLAQSLVIGGEFNGKRISKLVLNYICNAVDGLEAIPLDWASPSAWRRNDSAKECEIAWDAEEEALRFDYDFQDEANRWFYPERLLSLPEESFDGAVFLQFDIKSTQDKIENDFSSAFLMLLEETTHEWGNALLIDFQPPLDAWETRRIRLQRDDMNLARLQQIRLGANPSGHQVTIWMKNFKLLKAK